MRPRTAARKPLPVAVASGFLQVTVPSALAGSMAQCQRRSPNGMSRHIVAAAEPFRPCGEDAVRTSWQGRGD